MIQIKKKYFWFYLEHYIYFLNKGSDILLYNSLTRKYLIYKDKPLITKIMKKFQINKNLNVIRLSDDLLREPEIANFINKIKRYFFGDLIDVNSSNGKPIQFKPTPYIHEEIKKKKNNSLTFVDNDILKYLNEIFIYINNNSNYLPGLFNDAYKQFPCIYPKTRKFIELDLKNITCLLNQSNNSSLSHINIMGGDIFTYSKIKELIKILNLLMQTKTYYIYYLFSDLIEEYLDILDKKLSTMKVFITFPIKIDKLETLLKIFKKKELNYELVFIFIENHHFDLIEILAKKLNDEIFTVRPYYNGKNLSFFRKNVYINKKSILKLTPSVKEIFSKTFINPLNFGKLTIIPNGKIYANINQPSIGQLGIDSLYDIVYKEIYKGKSWRMTRLKVKPCTYCVLNALCPPISNYELIIGVYNACKN